jgi:hypothetical protein
MIGSPEPGPITVKLRRPWVRKCGSIEPGASRWAPVETWFGKTSS